MNHVIRQACSSSDRVADAPVSARTAIVYVTDGGFALPSAASALAVRRNVSAAMADIYVVTVGLAEDANDLLASVLQPRGVRVAKLDGRTYAEFDQNRFNKTHVPVAAMARFFLLQALPEIHPRILYLDGDVWPLASLDHLIDIDLPPGMFAAAEDTSYFCQRDRGPHGRTVRAYFRSIGVGEGAGYFNSGVLLAERRTWQEIADDAFRFFVRQPERCRYHDQSALNAVALTRRLRLSPRWNFLHLYREWGIAPASDARLLHFAGGFKPWTVPSPYYPGLFDAYREAFDLFGATDLRPSVLPPEEVRLFRRRLIRDRAKMNSVHLHRRWSRRREYLRLDADALSHSPAR